MFPALLAATMPNELTETAKLFAADSETFREWHARVLKLRTDAARAAAPQFRLMLAALMTDEALRRKVITIWKPNLWRHAVETVKRYQKRKQLRSDLAAERIARAIISLNLGYIVARALLAPDAAWDDEAEVNATVEMLLQGVAAPAK
jgi:hypothetical protein